MEKAQIQFLFQFLFIQIQTLENIKNRIEKVRPISEDKTNSLAYLIHNYYSCIEDVFKEIEKVFEEGGRFSTDSFYKDLLLHAKFELKGIRPRIISDNSYLILFDILKFRHLFRHAYNYDLNPIKVKENKILILENQTQLSEELKVFIAFLENIEFN